MTAAAAGTGGLHAWVLAARPKTLFAAATPVAVGTGLAVGAGEFAALPAAAALLGAFLLQIGANLANDYYDHAKGADTEERVGPTRATQAGLLRPEEVRNAAFGAFGLAVLVGTYLVSVGGWPIVAVGVASVAAGLAYTGGRWPLAYLGLGDLFVFAFFGPVAVVGTYYVQALAFSPAALAASVPIGLLATAILVVNNVRDAATDARAGKRTLVVRLGVDAGRAQYALLVLAAYALLPAVAYARGTPWPYVAFVAAPLAALLVVFVARESGPVLNNRLALTAAHLALFGAALAVGLAL